VTRSRASKQHLDPAPQLLGPCRAGKAFYVPARSLGRESFCQQPSNSPTLRRLTRTQISSVSVKPFSKGATLPRVKGASVSFISIRSNVNTHPHIHRNIETDHTRSHVGTGPPSYSSDPYGTGKLWLSIFAPNLSDLDPGTLTGAIHHAAFPTPSVKRNIDRCIQ